MKQPSTGGGHRAGRWRWIRSVTRTSAGLILAGLIAEAQLDPGVATAWRERVEISAKTDYDVVLDLMFGAAYHRLLHGHRPLTDVFARRVAGLITAGLARERSARAGRCSSP